MWLETEVGVGSTFGFAVPLVSAPESTSVAHEPEEGTDDSLVVIIEDDPGSMELLTLYLRSGAVTVVGAVTGVQQEHRSVRQREMSDVSAIAEFDLGGRARAERSSGDR